MASKSTSSNALPSTMPTTSSTVSIDQSHQAEASNDDALPTRPRLPTAPLINNSAISETIHPDPIAVLFEKYQKQYKEAIPTTSFAYEPAPDGSNKWTAMFTHPITNQTFLSGIIEGSKALTIDGINYYSKKQESKRAAAHTCVLANLGDDVVFHVNKIAPPTAHGSNIKNATQSIFEYFQKAEDQVSAANFSTRIENSQKHDLYSSVFTHPTTQEKFPAGILQDSEAVTIDGVHYYSRKRTAYQAASAFFLDCMQDRHADGCLCNGPLCTGESTVIVPATTNTVSTPPDNTGAVIPPAVEILSIDNIVSIETRIKEEQGPYPCFADVEPSNWKASCECCSKLKQEIENFSDSTLGKGNHFYESTCRIVSSGNAGSFEELYQLIDTNDQLEQCSLEMMKCEWIAFDTEFSNNKVICVISFSYTVTQGIQFENTKKTVVIDAIALYKDISLLLGPIFLSETIVKVAHAIEGDASCLYHSFGIGIKNCIDTQVAYGHVNDPSSDKKIGLVPLSIEVLGLSSKNALRHLALKSEFQRSNWKKRPLTKEQVEYCSCDCNHLYQITVLLFENIDIDTKKAILACSHQRCLNIQIPVPSRSFEISPLYSSVVRNKVMGSGLGSDIGPSHMVKLKKLLNWRTAVSMKFGISMGKIINDDSIVMRALLNDEGDGDFHELHIELSKLLGLSIINESY